MINGPELVSQALQPFRGNEAGMFYIPGRDPHITAISRRSIAARARGA